MLPLLASCANTFSELVPGSMPGVKGWHNLKMRCICECLSQY
jgi:hypothetical protein